MALNFVPCILNFPELGLVGVARPRPAWCLRPQGTAAGVSAPQGYSCWSLRPQGTVAWSLRP